MFRPHSHHPSAGGRASVLAVVAVLLLAMVPQASANDGVAGLGAGGLVLQRTDRVRMVSEDLHVSPDRIRVKYRFRPVGEEGLETIVAFPLPPIPVNNLDETVGMAEPPRRNPLDVVRFRVRVDGRRIRPLMAVRAFTDKGDITDLLAEYGIRPYDWPDYEAFERRLKALPAEARKKLEEAGALSRPSPDYMEYAWKLQITYFWRQRFPAGRDTRIEHEYVPIAGQFFYSPENDDWAVKRYCIDSGTMRGIRRMIRRQGPDRELLMATQVDYVLTTANTWAGPIGRFRLVIDKKRRDSIVTLCWKGLRKISPTRFESVKHDFRPQRDLEVLFLAPLPK